MTYRLINQLINLLQFYQCILQYTYTMTHTQYTENERDKILQP